MIYVVAYNVVQYTKSMQQSPISFVKSILNFYSEWKKKTTTTKYIEELNDILIIAKNLTEPQLKRV